MLDALWRLLVRSGVELQDALIFLPSRRAVRTVEKMLADKSGGAVILPHLVALGEGADELDQDPICDDDVISNTERVVLLAQMLAGDASIGNIATALPVARDLVRMTDYLENEGIDASQINWASLVDEKYAAHFQRKAALLNILSGAVRQYSSHRMTEAARRNADIRGWIDLLDNYKLVVVCGSTASVPATADLMASVASRPHGRIILSGKISGNADDYQLNTNPYNAEYKFLSRIGCTPSDVVPIDVGPSAIDFFNYAFGNCTEIKTFDLMASHCHLCECARESEEAAATAEIAARAVDAGKSVLIITPDAAGNQRLAAAMAVRGINADFSGAVPGTMTRVGRAILNLFDDWCDNDGARTFEKLYAASGYDLFKMIVAYADAHGDELMPTFDFNDAVVLQVFDAIKNLSDALRRTNTVLSLSDARAFLSDAIGTVGVRGQMNDAARVVVLGTIESRMQTADVVILTGLNDGMFPARGYENAWLPRQLAEQIGLPSPDRKVSLMSLDFMNLSCGADVWWMRSRAAGGIQTAESRFLSRVAVRRGGFDTACGDDVLGIVRSRDNVQLRPLDYSAPTTPADWSDVYVTELELLIHNPYAFYARHILRLRPLDDYWVLPDARKFGDLVHSVIEDARDFSPAALVAEMDRRARIMLGDKSIMFHFWHKRFLEIAPVVANELTQIQNASAEIGGMINIAGRNIRARADRVWDGGVMDIKTGAAPNKTQLLAGNMPQLPLEAFMLQSGGFHIPQTAKSQTPVMMFLQLKNGDVRPIAYDADTTAQMISAAVAKTTELVNMYSAGAAPYEYRETGDKKYQAYDDLARVRD